MESPSDREHSEGEIRDKSQTSQNRDSEKSIADSSAFAAMDLFKTYLDNKLSSFKRELKEEADHNTDAVVKKLKIEHSYNFKYTENKVQFEFIDDIDVEIRRIKRAADCGDHRKIKDICNSISEKIH